MKNFCEITNCNNEAKTTCFSCQKHICDWHSREDGLWYRFDPYESNFWTFRAIINAYRSSEAVSFGLNWTYYLEPQFHYFIDDYPEFIKGEYRSDFEENLTRKGTYRFFYEQVLPKVRLPEKHSLRESCKFCRECSVNHVRVINDKLDRDFYPVVKNVQKSGFICGIFDTCLVDVSKVDSHICGNCGEYCCPSHGLKCSACGKIFCTYFYYLKDVSSSDYSADYRYMTLGGCAKKHNHFFRSNNYKTLI